MAKEIKFDADVRAKMKVGADSLANAVKVTLGPTWLLIRSSVLLRLPRTELP